jgi:hypothetical protein
VEEVLKDIRLALKAEEVSLVDDVDDRGSEDEDEEW